MRLASVLLGTILLSCFSIQIQALAVGPGEAGDIAVPSISAPNMDVPAPLISAPNMDTPKPNPKPLVKPKSNPDHAINQTDNKSSNPNQTQAAQIQQQVKTLNVSGKWLIKFSDGTDRSLDLNLWPSSGNRIMGYGTLTEEGTKNPVAVSGSVTTRELSLIAKSAAPEQANQKYDEYDFNLLMVNDTLSGTYLLRSGGQSSGKGNATAERE